MRAEQSRAEQSRAEQSRAEQSRAEQSRAEQSRAEQSRADNIDILKATCAFLIVCIHVPFPGVIGKYFTALTRIAVPVFFMITGYFYFDVEEKTARLGR